MNNPGYPDPVGHSDSWLFLGALGAATKRITLATGAIVLPLRHPLHVAKAALSMDVLTDGRFVLGLGSGDRPSEFSQFGKDLAERRDLFRSHWSAVRQALHEGWTAADGAEFDIRPRTGRRIPLVAVGSSSQSLEWIARNAGAWMTYHRPLNVQKDRVALWHGAVAKSTSEFGGLGQAMVIDLLDGSGGRLEDVNLGYRADPDGVASALGGVCAAGMHHVAINLAGDERKALGDLQRLAADVLPRIS